jgi:lipopolysaccharide/colanic/teichoic acid biosynthesis glycosyltransferase
MSSSSGILVRKTNAARVAPAIGDRGETSPQALLPARYFRWKAVLDRTLAAILTIPALPIIAVLGLLVRLTSRGPAIYRQERIGKHGRAFFLYKLRSMRHEAEARTGAVWSTANDPRVTWLGKILRRLHLDELPQLVNVLRGEMSLVGPRPERPEFVEVLSRQIPRYRDRLAVVPGVTGLAQLNLPPDSDVTSVERKLVLDTEYIRTADLWLDLRILLCTGLRMLKLPAVGLFGIHRSVRDVTVDHAGAEPRPQGGDAQLTPDALKRSLEGGTRRMLDRASRNRGVRSDDPDYKTRTRHAR